MIVAGILAFCNNSQQVLAYFVYIQVPVYVNIAKKLDYIVAFKTDFYSTVCSLSCCWLILSSSARNSDVYLYIAISI
jgi:hypothetical protein